MVDHPTFKQFAHSLVAPHPPRNEAVSQKLDHIRWSFDDLIDLVALSVPNGPDATVAARAIHDACQACIFAVVHNQEEESDG